MCTGPILYMVCNKEMSFHICYTTVCNCGQTSTGLIFTLTLDFSLKFSLTFDFPNNILCIIKYIYHLYMESYHAMVAIICNISGFWVVMSKSQRSMLQLACCFPQYCHLTAFWMGCHETIHSLQVWPTDDYFCLNICYKVANP